MRVFGLLSWFDEEPRLLAQCIRSLSGVVDHLIAVDGGYALFPRATAASATIQAQVIRNVAFFKGMNCTVFQPQNVWQGNEVEKRNHLLSIASTYSCPDDWYLVIDADETLKPGFPVELLRTTECNVGLLSFDDDQYPGGNKIYAEGVRRLFRAHADITIGPHHGDYRLADGSWLAGHPRYASLWPALDLRPHGFTHHHTTRRPERNQRSLNYMLARAHHNEELTPCECGQPSIQRIWTNWRERAGQINGETKDVCMTCFTREHKRSRQSAEELGALVLVEQAGLI